MALTDKDLSAIKDIMKLTFEEGVEAHGLVTKEDIKHLPTKDDFYAETAKIYKKQDDLETEKQSISHRVSDLEDAVEELQSKAGITAGS